MLQVCLRLIWILEEKLSTAYEAVAMKEIVVAAVMGAVLWTSGCEIHEDVLHMRYILFFSSKVGAIIK